MLERLDYIKLAPGRILDAGSGPAREARALAARYPGATLVAADFSLAMLGARTGGWLRRNPSTGLCASLERLPLADGAFGLVWSNMALHCLPEPLDALKELHRVLGAEGLFMFSLLGPDSLKELRAVIGEQRVHAFHDMHDIGDMLVAAGFSAPVMDMEMLTLAYPAADGLLKDLRESGQTNARADRARGLRGKAFGARLRAALGTLATFEVVYGHAWKRAPVAENATSTAKTVRVFKRMP